MKYASLIPHESLSLHQIYRVSATEDLFDATIVYQKYAKAQARLDQAPTFTMKLHDAVQKTDMPLNILISPSAGSQLHVAVLIHGHISLPFPEGLIEAFATALAWLCHRSDREDKGNVREIEFFSPNDWQQVEEFSCGPRPLQDADLTIWQLVADRAQRSPKRIALDFYH